MSAPCIGFHFLILVPLFLFFGAIIALVATFSGTITSTSSDSPLSRRERMESRAAMFGVFVVLAATAGGLGTFVVLAWPANCKFLGWN